MKKIRTGIIGASSLVSGRLIELLADHPGVEITCLVSDYFTGRRVEEAHPHLRGLLDIRFGSYSIERIHSDCDLVFSAKPHGQSMEKIPEILDKGIKVVDISADFRLKDAGVFSSWYNVEHTAPQLLEKAVYGLPEIYGREVAEACLVANPGCYPTSVILGIAPLAGIEGFRKNCETIVVNSVSGISGAGRGTDSGTQFMNVSGNMRPYKAGTHRHTPEMEQEISAIRGSSVKVMFTPNVGPFKVGIASNIFLKLSDSDLSVSEISDLYHRFYDDKPFVRVYEPGVIPEIKDVADTNFCDIGFCLDHRLNYCIVFSVIDNLIKGAAGQAVQNMNIMTGFDEVEGLPYGHAIRKRLSC